MKRFSSPYSFALLIGVTLFVNGCNPQSIEENCHFKDVEKQVIIEFEEGDAQRIYFSPFENNKVLIEFWNAKHSMIEFDLITKDTQILNKNDWKRMYINRKPIYQDKKDSLVWVGSPNRELLKYSQKTKEVEFLPLKYVKRIVPYESKIYFVSYYGLYVKDRNSDEILKINDIPLEVIQSSELLDQKTLILDSEITYDLETGTWKEGIHLYSKSYKGHFGTFIAESGIGIFHEGGKLFYSTSTSLKELEMNRRLNTGAFDIAYPYIYGKLNEGIKRVNIETGELDTFEYRLPKVNNYSPNIRYDGDIIWIYRPEQLYFINTATAQNYNFPMQKGEHFKSMIYDDCHIYLLYEKRLEVRSKAEFIETCPPFSLVDYLADLQEYMDFVDSTGIKKEQDELKVVQKLRLIKERYANSAHPEILKQVDNLNISAFQSVNYETTTDFQKCYANENLPEAKRISCFKNLIKEKVSQSQFAQVLKYEEDFKTLFEPRDLESVSYFLSEIDSIRSYLHYYDSIGKAAISLDTLMYFRAMALNKVCRTSFFTQEGGYYDRSLVMNALERFNIEYPNSLLIDNSELTLLDYKHRYAYEGGYAPQLVEDLKQFKRKYPDSDKLIEADYRILSQLFYSEDERTKTGLVEKIEQFTKSYPDDYRVEELNHWINQLRK